MAAVLLLPLFVAAAHAESQTARTDGGALDVRLTYDTIEPGEGAVLGVEFVNPQTQRVQEHIDYTVAVSKGGSAVFGPIPLTHTSPGSVSIPVEFSLGEGVYSVDLGVEGILFQPIPKETASFDIPVGMAAAPAVSPGGGGGCLVATAAFGSELAPQVQHLREIRDNVVLQTASGAAFMSAFNHAYYAFSPAVADMQRSNPALNELVRAALAPMIHSLALLDGAEISSDAEMLAHGIPLVLLNAAVYLGVPAFGVVWLARALRR